MTSPITYFGIRHHGPGCASSLCKALKALKPDCILIEGPTGAEDLLSFVQNEELKPPIALLSYCVDDPSLSIFHPFALFSPEWQVILFAKQNSISVSFIDLPAATTIAQMKQKRDAFEEKIADEEKEKSTNNHQGKNEEPSEVVSTTESDKDNVNPLEQHVHDPLDWLAHAAGYVPSNVPIVPLQKDVQSQQRSLRLKPEALEKDLNLDLRNENDLARSHLLHRLNLLGIDWGELSHVRQKGKGTFHECWRLSWQPQYEVDIIVASRYGHSVEAAACRMCEERAEKTKHLSELTELMNKVLLANLPKAVQTVTQTLEKRSVESADPIDLLNALPALANIHRYGNVRQTDAAQVTHLFDSILQRAVIALPLAVFHINTDAAQSVRQTLLSTDRAITLRAGNEQTLLWHQALHYIVSAQSAAALLRGLCTRLLLDNQIIAHKKVLGDLRFNLSTGSDAQNAAQWLDGFLNRNAAVLLHNDDLWSLIDEWLCSLHQEHFVAILPLIRRTFSEFEAADRRDLGIKAKNAPHKKAYRHADKIQVENQWDEARVQKVIPTLAALLGLTFNVKE